MHNDKTTLKDLSIFSNDGEDVFSLINLTVTHEGKATLVKHIQHPPDKLSSLQEMQDTIRYLAEHPEAWTEHISNGTIVMLEKFFEGADDTAPPTGITLLLNNFFQKILNKEKYFIIRFSLSHLSDFLKGCMQLTEMLDKDDVPLLLRRELEMMKDELKHPLTRDIIDITKETPYSGLSRLSYNARRQMKNLTYRLITHYARLDAWRAMANATLAHNWVFPQLLEARPVHFEAEALYHPLLQNPTAYDLDFDNNRNFLLLTGANMSGKTTFMRSLGVAALLAHLGMGVPARSLRISFLHGVITNMHVEDNLMRGESYFFAEVQRMKLTAQKLLESEPHLVLMDELFKGTNVHDAYECTRAVVDGLLHRPNHLMILSTHLYEVAQYFKDRKEIIFAYFITKMLENDTFYFTYELKEGISDDRIGYRILQKEGVLELLNNQKMGK